jgi:hypothetical protein
MIFSSPRKKTAKKIAKFLRNNNLGDLYGVVHSNLGLYREVTFCKSSDDVWVDMSNYSVCGSIRIFEKNFMLLRYKTEVIELTREECLFFNDVEKLKDYIKSAFVDHDYNKIMRGKN